ncbi:MAG: butyrate kinase [Planctomycetota bacterium]|jgi:butyrate kinase
MPRRVLAVNPGSTATRVALFEDGRRSVGREARCDPARLAAAARSADQIDFRTEEVRALLAEAGVGVGDLDAVAARGGPLAPVPGGTYRVNEAMLADALSDRFVDHVSRIACVIADRLARPAGIPAFVVDPVSVDEYAPLARISGLPELPRRSLTHALNIRASAHRFAGEVGRPLSGLRLIVAHLGGGISVAAVSGGRMVDSADANGEGPMSPERSGGLRVDDLVDLCFRGEWTREELKRRLTREAGLSAHLGTTDGAEVERRAASGDPAAAEAFEAMCYQVSKHVAAMSAALEGPPDAVILTGGLARSERAVRLITDRVSFLGRTVVYPGENEMEALCAGVERVLSGAERPRVYPTGQEESQ